MDFHYKTMKLGISVRNTELIGSADGLGLKGTFTREGGWGKQRQAVDNAEDIEPQDAHEHEPLTV